MDQDHIPILRAFDDLKFNVGKKTLLDLIKGDPNPTIQRNSLDELDCYGCLYMLEKGEILNIIDQLIKNKFLELASVTGGFQVVKITPAGRKEMFERKFQPLKNTISISKFKVNYGETIITEEDKKHFKAFDFLLNKYNDEQKKAIISQSKNILCVAGAGSGKTTVLTKRIEFLTKFKSIDERKILAITFTRKAREEMEHRLKELQIEEVQVETFNSFCEKTLKKHGDKIYDEETVVAQFRDKIAILTSTMKDLSIPFDSFYEEYFTKRQLREKSKDDLFFIFVNDVFSIIDYYKNLEQPIKDFYNRETHSTKKRIAKLVHDIAKATETKLKEKNLRDFSDQILDTLRLYRENEELIPKFEHILVDEFQDVNLVQYEMLKLMKSDNLFAVGDPRQAIYGWRGSEIRFIMDFPKEFKDTEVIQLKMNYRSIKQIVTFANASIKKLGLVDLDTIRTAEENSVFLMEQDNELLERRFVLEAIKNSKNPRNEIFVLARTNRVLENFADFFSKNGVRYTIKSEEEYKSGEPQEDEVVLATVHSIKGMEAKEVYLVGANTLSFPNKVVDNFVFALMKEGDEYDKNAEELRLFYVALTRAKDKLIITYTGNYSKFITNDMLSQLMFKEKNKSLFEFDGKSYKSKNVDNSNATALKNMIKSWRSELSNKTGLPTYMIISNNAIEDIVKLRPASKVELLNVNGMGDAKIAKYGDEIIKIVNG